MQHPKDISAREDSEEEEDKREDLYSIVRDLREGQDNPPISRILYTGYLNEGVIQSKDIEMDKKIPDIIAQLQKQVKESDEKILSSITGFFLQKGNFCIHLLEGDSQLLNQFMTEIYQIVVRQKSEFTVVRIIAFNEENPSRMFDKHYAETVQSTGSISLEVQSDNQPQQYQDKAWQIYQNFCEAGQRHIQKSHKERLNKRLPTEIILSNDDMSMLLQNHFMSIEEYAQLYLEDLEIKLDPEVEFPFKIPLTRYLEYADQGCFEDVVEL